MISDAVPITIAATLTHAITLIAFVDFFALKYRQAKRNFNGSYLLLGLLPEESWLLISLNNASILST